MENIRIYKNHIPNVGEIVMIKIMDIQDFITVNIIEFKIDGIIVFAQIPKKQIKNLKIGQIHVAEVINNDNNNVDLSMLRINKNDEDTTKDKYEKNKHIISILYELNIQNIPEQLYDYDFLKNASKNKELLNDLSIDNDLLFKILQKHFKNEKVKISKKIKMTCFSEHGVYGIVNSLKKAEQIEGISINFISSPFYTIETENIENGDELINKALEIINTEILTYSGKMEIC